MPIPRPTFFPVALYVLLCISYAYSNPQASVEKSARSAALHIARTATTIEITGAVSSAAHEAILRQTAAKFLPELRQEFSLEQPGALAPGWALLSELALRATAQTATATIDIRENVLRIAGITDDVGGWQAAATRLHEHLLPGMRFIDDVIGIRASASHQAQCLGLLREAATGRNVQFEQAGAAISSTAFGLLDEIIQIAADCPATSMTITGHTDASGDEAENRRLSEARARAVANYLVARGIAEERLAVEGAGSANPLMPGTGAHARKINRRIEFSFQ